LLPEHNLKARVISWEEERAYLSAASQPLRDDAIPTLGQNLMLCRELNLGRSAVELPHGLGLPLCPAQRGDTQNYRKQKKSLRQPSHDSFSFFRISLEPPPTTPRRTISIPLQRPRSCGEKFRAGPLELRLYRRTPARLRGPRLSGSRSVCQPALAFLQDIRSAAGTHAGDAERPHGQQSVEIAHASRGLDLHVRG
jgi:hypothetical protein